MKLSLYCLLLLLFLLHRFLLCPFSLIPDVLLVLYHFTPKFNALTSHLSGIFLHIFSDIEKQRYKSCSKSDFNLLSYLCEVEAFVLIEIIKL